MTVVFRSPQNTCVTLHHGAAATGRFPLRMSMDKRVGAVGLQDIKKRLMAASPFDEPCQLGCALPAVIAVRQMAWNRQ